MIPGKAIGANYQVAVLIGSLRKDSITRKMAMALNAYAPARLGLEIIETGNLPLYNEDLETVPVNPAWGTYRHKVKAADAVLFVTPEYNRSVPGALKNAIDVGSAPHGHNVFDGKPGAIISLSVGTLGAFGANHHLRQSLVFLNVHTMQQPEAYICNSETLFDADGAIHNERTSAFISHFLKCFDTWVERCLHNP